jgi:hypothetical protein
MTAAEGASEEAALGAAVASWSSPLAGSPRGASASDDVAFVGADLADQRDELVELFP